MTLVHQLYDLSADDKTLLNVCDKGDISIAVHQYQNYRWLFTGGRSIQSVMSLTAPQELYLPTQKVMLTALLLQPSPRRILNLGFGGGGFERFFQASDGDLRLTSVDLNPQLVELSRRYLLVPDNWPVNICDAQDFLKLPHPACDLILCDIFNGEYHAGCLNDENFYRDAAVKLADNGVMAINLSPTSDKALVELLRVLRRHFPGVMLSKVDTLNNIVVIAMKQNLPSMVELGKLTDSLSAQWLLPFADLLAGFKALPTKVDVPAVEAGY